jgi:FAD/FMN-containing dehydrogenase
VKKQNKKMGNLFNSPIGATIDEERTKAAEALAAKYKEKLDKISFDGKLTYAKQGSEAYHAIRSDTFAFNDGGYPYAIFTPNSAQDVAKVVKGLNGLGLEVAVAGGRHSPMAMPDGCVVINMEKIKFVDVNVTQKTVSVGGGCKIGEVDGKLSEMNCGLGFVTGTNGDTGVAGLTLLGGWGFLARKHGMACDNLLEAEVVLADGRILVCTDDNENKMLLRALRGGGGNFGIVTRLVFRLHYVNNMYAGEIVRFCPTVNSAKLVMQEVREINANAPVNAGGAFALPCGAPVLVNLASYCANADEPEFKSYAEVPYMKDLANVRGQWFNIVNKMRPVNYHKECQKMLEANQVRGFLHPAGYCVKHLSDEMIDVLLHFTRTDYVNRKSAIIVALMGGNIQKSIPGRPHAMSHRENAYWIIMEPTMKDNTPEELALHLAWAGRIKEAVKKIDGQCIQAPHHFFDSVADQEKNKEIVYFGEGKQFLREAKTKYDPQNFFHKNSNILPLSSTLEKS